MNKPNHIKIYTDGGSRGNPGSAAYGVYITDTQGNKIIGFGKTLGVTTNNVAEYTAVIAAMEWVYNHRDNFSQQLHINIFMDSLLVCSQVTGKWKVKSESIGNLLVNLREKQKQLQATVTYTHIPREKNQEADRYVNLALDKKI